MVIADGCCVMIKVVSYTIALKERWGRVLSNAFPTERNTRNRSLQKAMQSFRVGGSSSRSTMCLEANDFVTYHVGTLA